MPSSCPEVVRKSQSKSTARPAKLQRRETPALCGLAARSRVIEDGITTEATLCEWVGWFARFHTDPTELYIPLALRTVDCIISGRERQPSAPQVPRLMRCVREVAKFNGVQRVEWLFITWVPGLPGVQLQRCASYDDAMRLLDAPAASISL